MNPLRYEDTGVRYDSLDAFKRACQQEAAGTLGALAAHGLKEPAAIRGESAYLIEAPDEFLAHVEEGLGTKNLVADAMGALTGNGYYANIGIDTVATIVNDMITTGALPISVAMHAAVGDAGWFDDQVRAADLIRGFGTGCRQANAVWGGGETPALKDLVEPGSIVLAGSAVGRIRPKTNRITGDIRDGDAIIFLASSGVHTNGLTLCRAVADRLPQGYLTKLDDGRTYGESLLDPSIIYVPFIAACQGAGLKPRYSAHITGHGWRKLMRLVQPLVYRITHIGAPPPVFRFIQAAAGIDEREMYGTFNMGAGFAIFVDPREVSRYIDRAQSVGISAWRAGHLASEGTRKAVVIEPLDIAYEADSLQVR